MAPPGSGSPSSVTPPYQGHYDSTQVRTGSSSLKSGDPLSATPSAEAPSTPSDAQQPPAMSRGSSRRTQITFDGSSAFPSPRASYDVRRPGLSRQASEASMFIGEDGSLLSKTPASSTIKLADLPKRPPLSRGNTGITVQENVELGCLPSGSTEKYPRRPPNSRGVSERSFDFLKDDAGYPSRPDLGSRGLSNMSKLSTGNLDSAFDDEAEEMEDQVPEYMEGSKPHNPRSGATGSEQWSTTFRQNSVTRRPSQLDPRSNVEEWAYHGPNRADNLSHVGDRPQPLSFLQRVIKFFEPVTFHPQEFEEADSLNRSKSELTSRPSVVMEALDHDAASARTTAVDSSLKSAGEQESNTSSQAQGRPILLPSFTAEILFVLVCSSGQFLFQFLLGAITILQRELVDNTLHMSASQAPWLTGSYLLANGLSVTISGALADIYGPRKVITSALGFLTLVNIIGAALGPDTHGVIVFLFIRAFQGLATGGLTSSSISYLGRIYRSGQRKNRIFSTNAALAPCGFVIGGIQGGALGKRIDWWFGSNAIICFIIFALAWKYSPTESALRQYEAISEGLTIDSFIEKNNHEPKRKFDYFGSILAVAGCGLVIFGLTQGSSAMWSAYTWATLIGGIALLALFPYVESKVSDPLVPNGLWKVKGFGSVILTYGLSFGSFTAYQFYACQFWLWIQGRPAIIVGLYFIPALTVGVLATLFVARLFHMMPGHWLMGAGCLASAIAPGMFIANKPWTTYWALGMPAIAIGTLSPDLSFASASIFITSAVSRKYQGVAGSMLLTVQSLAGSMGTAFTETVADQIKEKNLTVLSLTPAIRHVGAVGTSWMGTGHHTVHGEGTMLSSLHGAWWFDLGASLAAFFLAIFFLRVPKAVEQDHQE